MGPKKEKTPTPESDVLRDAKDAPLEGPGWIHGFIPSSALLFKRQCVVLSCARSCRWPTRPSMKWSNAENSPRRFFLTSRCVVWDLAEVEAWIEERRRASDAASIQRAPTPDMGRRKTRPVRHQ
jgi:prophage regulatory protein